MNDWITRRPLIEEVKGALDSMKPNKALGPDGFTMAFLKCFWDLVKTEVMVLINEVFDEKDNLALINKTLSL